MAQVSPIESAWNDMQGRMQSLTDRLRQHYVARTQNRDAANPEELAPPQRANEPVSVDENSLRETYAEYEVRRDTNQIIIRIIDAANGDLIRAVPSEEFAKEVASGQAVARRNRRRNVQA